jgi:hypothetical protein
MSAPVKTLETDWWANLGKVADDQISTLEVGEFALLFRDNGEEEAPLTLGQVIGHSAGTLMPIFHSHGGYLFSGHDVTWQRYILKPPGTVKEVEPTTRFNLRMDVSIDLNDALEIHGIVAAVLRQHAALVEANCAISQQGGTQHVTPTAIATVEWQAESRNLVFSDKPVAPDFSLQFGIKEVNPHGGKNAG